MCIPLIALIIGLVFFFGFSMANRQHVEVSDRYAAWRAVRAGTTVSPDRLNKIFFAGRAGDVRIETGTGPAQTLDDLVTEAGRLSRPAELLAGRLVLERFPRGRSARLAAEFPSTVGLWQHFTGAITDYHVRDGLQWRREDQASPRSVLAEDFLYSLDNTVRSIQSPGDLMGLAIRGLYIDGW